MDNVALIEDRVAGGHVLARALEKYRGSDGVVYGLPRGGVITARVVADDLGLPLDLLITRKLTHPSSPEYAIGAITDDGEVVLNDLEMHRISAEYLAEEKARRLSEAKQRRAKFLGGRKPVPVQGKTAIIVDDGIATGYTLKAAILAVRKLHPARIVVAAPVASPDVFAEFEREADEVIVPYTPEGFYAIGAFYGNFIEVSDEDVMAAIQESDPDAELKSP